MSEIHSHQVDAMEHGSDRVDFSVHETEKGVIPTDPARTEAPVTWKAYLMCAFASFGGIFYGYDSGWISGVLAMPYVINAYTGLPIPGPNASAAETAAFVISSSHKSLITSILSAGTFIGAVAAGDFADWYGRRYTILGGIVIFMVGVVLETASHGVGLMAAGRAIAGLGVGFVSAVIILYMSEIAPRKIRGALVSGYQFCITIGLFLAAIVNYCTKDRTDSGSYRIPIAIQFAWALILFGGIFWLPDSPRYYVKKGNVARAKHSLSRLRGQPADSLYVQEEVAEIVANYQYEMAVIPTGGYWSSWKACFTGGLRNPGSNLRRTILGTALQMFQQWTGVNFIFYFGTTFFTQLGTISNPFLITVITDLVNVCSTPFSFFAIERYGRRAILIWGAVGMTICEFIVAIIGTVKPNDDTVTKVQIAFICIYIFFFATTYGPAAWVVVGETFPIPIRSRGVGLSTASNWLWNCIIAVITPYLVDTDEANLSSKVFFLWGSLCACCIVFAYFCVYETKGLTLEQVDQLMEQSSPRHSAKWRPTQTMAEAVHQNREIKRSDVVQKEDIRA